MQGVHKRYYMPTSTDDFVCKKGMACLPSTLAAFQRQGIDLARHTFPGSYVLTTNLALAAQSSSKMFKSKDVEPKHVNSTDSQIFTPKCT